MFTVPNPPGTGAAFDDNEPWRRVCERPRIHNGVALPYTNGAGVH